MVEHQFDLLYVRASPSTPLQPGKVQVHNCSPQPIAIWVSDSSKQAATLPPPLEGWIEVAVDKTYVCDRASNGVEYVTVRHIVPDIFLRSFVDHFTTTVGVSVASGVLIDVSGMGHDSM